MPVINGPGLSPNHPFKRGTVIVGGRPPKPSRDPVTPNGRGNNSEAKRRANESKPPHHNSE